MSGGAALVRFGGELSAANVVIEDSEAVKQLGAVAVKYHNMCWRRSGRPAAAQLA